MLEYEFMRDCEHVRKFSLPAELRAFHMPQHKHTGSANFDQPLPSLFTWQDRVPHGLLVQRRRER